MQKGFWEKYAFNEKIYKANKNKVCVFGKHKINLNNLDSTEFVLIKQKWLCEYHRGTQENGFEVRASLIVSIGHRGDNYVFNSYWKGRK